MKLDVFSSTRHEKKQRKSKTLCLSMKLNLWEGSEKSIKL